jgi:hypothetical protein
MTYTPKFGAQEYLVATNAAQRHRRNQKFLREMQIQSKIVTFVRGFDFWSRVCALQLLKVG